MSLNYERLMAWPFQDIKHQYSESDCILYALAIGIGDDPTDPKQLQYVYEKGLRTFPTMPIVLGMGDVGFLTDPEVGIDLPRMLHGSTSLSIHRLPPAGGTIVSRMAIDSVVDKGPDKGAILNFSRRIRDADTQELLAVESGAFMLRGNGGFGGNAAAPRTAPVAEMTDRPCDVELAIVTRSHAGLLYRLTGDRNPLHADPFIARSVGFNRPILHGSCTYGVIARALLLSCCEYDGSRMRTLNLRFTAPVFPGETLHTQIWQTGPGSAVFRTRSLERGVVVADNGLFEHAP